MPPAVQVSRRSGNIDGLISACTAPLDPAAVILAALPGCGGIQAAESVAGLSARSASMGARLTSVSAGVPAKHMLERGYAPAASRSGSLPVRRTRYPSRSGNPGQQNPGDGARKESGFRRE